jgi:CRISPR-associated protein Cas2
MSETARHRFLVCYDVSEPKRLRRTHQIMLGFGDPLQYSVFVCDLSAMERLLMEDALRRSSHPGEDRVHLIDLGPATGIARRRIRSLTGAPPPSPRRHTVL